MKAAEIRKYAKLMAELGLTGLEITAEGQTLRLERTAAETREIVTIPAQVAAAGAAANAAPEAPAKRDNDDTVCVCSPLVGIFYAAPAENEDPYVTEGDRVKQGTTLCIIEAMKLMNEVVAEFDGEIVEICVENGQRVDYGCELFRMRRTD